MRGLGGPDDLHQGVEECGVALPADVALAVRLIRDDDLPLFAGRAVNNHHHLLFHQRRLIRGHRRFQNHRVFATLVPPYSFVGAIWVGKLEGNYVRDTIPPQPTNPAPQSLRPD